MIKDYLDASGFFGWKRLRPEEWYRPQVQRSSFWSEKHSFLSRFYAGFFYRERVRGAELT